MYCFPSHKLNLLKQMSNTFATGSCHCRMLEGGLDKGGDSEQWGGGWGWKRDMINLQPASSGGRLLRST